MRVKRSKPTALVTAQPGLTDALGRAAASTFTNSVSRASAGRSFSDLLSDLYAQADNLIADIASSGEPAVKRAEALKSVAKILPLLQAAERNARTSIKGKAAEDMEAGELRDLVRAILAEDNDGAPVPTRAAKKVDFPQPGASQGGSTQTLTKTKKSVRAERKKITDSDVRPFPTANLSDDELRSLADELDEDNTEPSDEW